MSRGRRPDPPLDVDLTAEGDAKDRQFITALARGLEVLRAFQPGDVGLGNQEIAERTGLPKPTVSRLTHTLTRLGYLEQEGHQGKYQLAAGVLALGFAFLNGMDVRERARPLMQALANDVNAAVSLGQRDRLSMVYLETCRGQGAITLRLDVGARIPIHATAMGLAFLAALPATERDFLLGHVEKRYPAEMNRVRDAVARAADDLDRYGFVVSCGLWQPDVNAVGVPLFKPDGSATFALNCGGAAFLLSREQLIEDIGPRLRRLAETLTGAPPAVIRGGRAV